MLLDLSIDTLKLFLQFLPLVIGAYITISILRFPDFTIDASWSLGGILACILIQIVPVPVALFGSGLTGMLCGLTTSGFFVIGGRAKLLAGLASYLVLQAVGARFLGEEAAIYIERRLTGIGMGINTVGAWSLYIVIDIALFLLIILWQESGLGIRARLVGERPHSAVFLRFSLTRTFVYGLLFSNAIIALGGGLWSCYYGQASNLQGIGMIIAAFFALLMGEETLRAIQRHFPKLLRRVRRETAYCCLFGTILFVFLHQGSGYLSMLMNKVWPSLGIRPTDKHFVIGVAIVLILLMRTRTAEERAEVSLW